MPLKSSKTTLVLAMVLAWTVRIEASGVYSVTELDSWNNRQLGFTPALTNQGQVVGGWLVPGGGGSVEVPYIYDSTTGKVTLPTVTSPSGTDRGSYGTRGEFTGSSDGGVIYGPGLMYFNGHFIPAGAGGGIISVNDSGQKLTTAASQAYPTMGNFRDSNVVQNGVITRVGPPPGAVDAEGVAINNAGTILVNTDNPIAIPGSTAVNPQQGHAFMLSGQKWTELGTLGGNTTRAMGMNQNSDVVGWSNMSVDGTAHAVLIPFGKPIVDLGSLKDSTFNMAEGINNLGQIVGLAATNNTDYRGFIYQNGVMEDLNDLLKTGSDFHIRWALGINDRGQILAYGINKDGNADILLLNPGDPAPAPILPALPLPPPTPEPSTLLIMGVGISCLAARGVYLRSARSVD